MNDNEVRQLMAAIAAALRQAPSTTDLISLIGNLTTPPETTEGKELLESFTKRGRNYRHYARTARRWLLDVLASPAALELMRSAAELGLPAVAKIAEMVIREAALQGRTLTNTDRQFVGAVVCFVMEENGYRKTGRRGIVFARPFTQGHIYGGLGESDLLN